MNLQIGMQAPLFCLPNQDGIEVCLRDFLGSRVIVYFYPKDNTPGCTKEACDFRDALESLDAVVLGISPDGLKSHQHFIAKENLNFTLLSDESKEVLKIYESWGLKKHYGKEYEGVKRNTFLIDENGKIAWIWENVKVDGHIGAIKQKLQELNLPS